MNFTPKRSRNQITLDQKREIIQFHDENPNFQLPKISAYFALNGKFFDINRLSVRLLGKERNMRIYFVDRPVP